MLSRELISGEVGCREERQRRRQAEEAREQEGFIPLGKEDVDSLEDLVRMRCRVCVRAASCVRACVLVCTVPAPFPLSPFPPFPAAPPWLSALCRALSCRALHLSWLAPSGATSLRPALLPFLDSPSPLSAAPSASLPSFSVLHLRQLARLPGVPSPPLLGHDRLTVTPRFFFCDRWHVTVQRCKRENLPWMRWQKRGATTRL